MAIVCLVKMFVIKMVMSLLSMEFLRIFMLKCRLYGNRWIIFTVIAAQSIANIVKSSLGPLGLDKMLVDNIGVRAYSHAPQMDPAMILCAL